MIDLAMQMKLKMQVKEGKELYHFVLVWLWNGRSCNFHVNFLPHLGHITNGLGAKRASISVAESCDQKIKFLALN